MIIKVKAHNGWDFFDNVASVMSRSSDRLSEANSEAHSRLLLPDFEDLSVYPYFHGMAGQEGKDLGLVISFLHYGKPCEMYTNMEVYLLNDNGKTIERLI